MTDRAAIRAGMAGAILAAICWAAALLAVLLPLAGLGARLAHAGLVALSLLVAFIGLVMRSDHHRRSKAACRGTKIDREGVRP